MSRREEHMFSVDRANFKTPRQAAAAQALLEEVTPERAARALGCSREYLRGLLGREEFRRALGREKQRFEEERRQWMEQRILEEWQAIAFADAGEYLSGEAAPDGGTAVTLRDLRECPDTRAISEIIPCSGGSVKVKFYDKAQALQQLGKLLGLSGQESTPQKILVELKGETGRWAK